MHPGFSTSFSNINVVENAERRCFSYVVQFDILSVVVVGAGQPRHQTHQKHQASAKPNDRPEIIIIPLPAESALASWSLHKGYRKSYGTLANSSGQSADGDAHDSRDSLSHTTQTLQLGSWLLNRSNSRTVTSYCTRTAKHELYGTRPFLNLRGRPLQDGLASSCAAPIFRDRLTNSQTPQACISCLGAAVGKSGVTISSECCDSHISLFYECSVPHKLVCLASLPLLFCLMLENGLEEASSGYLHSSASLLKRMSICLEIYGVG